MPSFETKIFHHLIILVLQHVAVPYISFTRRVKTERLTIIVTKLYPHHCHHVWGCVNYIPEHLLPGLRQDCVSYSVKFGIQHFWMFVKTSIGGLAIDFGPVFNVRVNINGKRHDFLHVDEVKVHGVSVGSEIDDVEIIHFSDLESDPGPFALCRHFHGNAINHHANTFQIFAFKFNKRGEYFFPFTVCWVLYILF